jgi:DNA-3-methyladenine glycosylase I
VTAVEKKPRMSSDVIIGYGGKPRCAWAGVGDTAFRRYHDEVWGTRTCDESALFEALTLGVFEVGLSWSTVFGKRDASEGRRGGGMKPEP